jgi:hypothetical protein
VIEGVLVQGLGRFLIRFAVRGGTPLLLGLVAGIAAFVLAVLDDREITGSFYSVCAQVFPVFVVALVVEQRLADRLGITENEWVERSWSAWTAYTDPPSLPPDALAEYQEDWAEQYADYRWVAGEGFNDLTSAARSRYRRKVAVQSATILFVVLGLVIGEVAAILGVIDDGTTADSPLYAITTSMFAASFTAIVASAAGELFRGVARGVAEG